MASLHAPRRTRRWVPSRLPAQAGLTIVETMVAMMLLLVGVLGTVSLIDVSNTSAANSRARDGATNLARELLENAHDTSYSQVAATSTWLNPTMQGLSGGSGSVTNPDSHSAQTSVSRRGVCSPLPTGERIAAKFHRNDERLRFAFGDEVVHD